MQIDSTTAEREFAHMTEEGARLLWRVTLEIGKDFDTIRFPARLCTKPERGPDSSHVGADA